MRSVELMIFVQEYGADQSQLLSCPSIPTKQTRVNSHINIKRRYVTRKTSCRLQLPHSGKVASRCHLCRRHSSVTAGSELKQGLRRHPLLKPLTSHTKPVVSGTWCPHTLLVSRSKNYCLTSTTSKTRGSTGSTTAPPTGHQTTDYPFTYRHKRH